MDLASSLGTPSLMPNSSCVKPAGPAEQNAGSLNTFFGSKYDPLCIMDGKWNLGDQKRFWGCCTQLLFGGGNDAGHTDTANNTFL